MSEIIIYTSEDGAISDKTQTKKVAIGYCVRSIRGVQFRQYASTVLKEYLQKGFAMDDERLKGFALDDERLKNISVIAGLTRNFYLQRIHK